MEQEKVEFVEDVQNIYQEQAGNMIKSLLLLWLLAMDNKEFDNDILQNETNKSGLKNITMLLLSLLQQKE